MAEAALLAAAAAVLAGGGPAEKYIWRRCYYRAVAVRAALAAMVVFGLGERNDLLLFHKVYCIRSRISSRSQVSLRISRI